MWKTECVAAGCPVLGKVLGFLNVEFINVRKSGDRVVIPLWRKPLLQLV